MESFNDPTPQEMNRQNEKLIRILEQLFEQECHLPPPIETNAFENQAIENVRRRLLAWEQQKRKLEEEPSPSPLTPGMQLTALDIYPDHPFVPRRHKFGQRFGQMLGIVAIFMAMVLSGGVFAHFAAQQKQSGFIFSSVQNPHTIQQQARGLVLQFHHEADVWGHQHQYYDPFDGKTYPLDLSYTRVGLGSELDYALDTAITASDYTAVVAKAREALFTLHQFEANLLVPAVPNVPHISDLQLLKLHHWERKQVIVISLGEQYLRLYQNGRLQRTIVVQAGSYTRPMMPGAWMILKHRQITVGPNQTYQGQPGTIYMWDFAEARSSPHAFHMFCSVWENDIYGPGSQFPHPVKGKVDWRGIILSRLDGEWLHYHTNLETQILVY